MRWRLAWAALLTIVLALGGIFFVVIWDAHEQERLGQVHFPISCSAASQRLFDFATARLHSLRFTESEQIYAAITAAEPDCAIAYWGIAMSRLKRPIPGARPAEDVRAAQEALQSANGASVATARERAYIAALSLLFERGDVAPWNDRTMAYEQAMGALAARERDDQEATVFYALALNMVPVGADADFRRRTKAAELLLAVLANQPHHPGLSHYLTYCLRAPEEQTSDAPAVSPDRLVSSIQGGLAAVALVGVCAFFVAVLPVWSRAKSAHGRA